MSRVLTANFNQGAAPGRHVAGYQRGGNFDADPVNGINGNGWSGSSYSGIGIGNNMTFVGPSSNNHYTLPAGTYLLATLPTGLTAADFGNSRDPLGSTADNALGSVVYANGMGNETLDKVHGHNNGTWGKRLGWRDGELEYEHQLVDDVNPHGQQYGNLWQSGRQYRGRGGGHGEHWRHPERRLAVVHQRQFLHAPGSRPARPARWP